MIAVRKTTSDSLESLLRRFKSKVSDCKVLKQYMDNMSFTKPSEKKRSKRNRNKLRKKLLQIENE